MKKFRFDLFIETSILGHCKFILLILSLIKMEYFFPIGTSVHSGQNGNYSQASNCLPMHLDEYMGWKAFTLMVNYFWCHQHLAVSIFINIDSRCTFPKCFFFLTLVLFCIDWRSRHTTHFQAQDPLQWESQIHIDSGAAKAERPFSSFFSSRREYAQRECAAPLHEKKTFFVVKSRLIIPPHLHCY